MAKRFLIKKSTAIKLFKSLGFKTAENWPTDRLQSKLKKLPEIADGENVGEWAQGYLDRIERADEVIIKEKEEETMATKKKKKKGKKKEVVEEKVVAKKSKKASKKKTDKKKVAKKSEKKTATKKVGVIASILEIIKANGPISKEGILKRMVKRFPDRPGQGMKNTISIQVPGRLNNDKNAKIKKDDKDRFFIK